MTNEEILQLARESGATDMKPYDYGAKPDRSIFYHKDIIAFANAVRAAALEEAAFICEREGVRIDAGWTSCAAAIREAKQP
jgi:hypothetical protein